MNSKMGFYINLPYKMFPYKLCDILFVPLHHIHLRYHIFHITTKIFMLHKCKHILCHIIVDTHLHTVLLMKLLLYK
jgi:hypothetical protein